YFTEDDLSPGAARGGNCKAVFNLRGDDGQATGALAVDSNLGWKGPSKYAATVPQVFDLWQDDFRLRAVPAHPGATPEGGHQDPAAHGQLTFGLAAPGHLPRGRRGRPDRAL